MDMLCRSNSGPLDSEAKGKRYGLLCRLMPPAYKQDLGPATFLLRETATLTGSLEPITPPPQLARDASPPAASRARDMAARKLRIVNREARRANGSSFKSL